MSDRETPSQDPRQHQSLDPRQDTASVADEAHDPPLSSQAYGSTAATQETEDEQTSGGRRWLKIVLPLLLLVVGGGFASLLINSKAPVEKSETAPPPPLVRVMAATPRSLSLDVSSQGTVAPRTEASLVAEVGGRIVSTASSFAAGGFFERGQVLLRLDARDYELAVIRSEAEVARARTLLERERAEADVARREWEELGRDGDPSPLVVRDPQVAEAEANLAAAQANLASAKLGLDRTVVRAPFEGRVREKRADVGQYVAPGQSLGQVYAVDYVEIQLPIPDGELAFLNLPSAPRGADAGPPVSLESEYAGQRQRWTGRIVRTGGEIDRQSRMVHLIARVDDPYRTSGGNTPPLAVGLFVNATIDGVDVDGVFVLPRVALRGEDRVMVLDEESRLRFRPVSVLRRIGDVVIIDGGIASGDKVCISPLEAPVEGMAVRTVEEDPIPFAAPADGSPAPLALAKTPSVGGGGQ